MAKPSLDRPLSLPAAALWATALWLLEHTCFEVTEALRPGAITDIVNVAACVVLATSAIIFAMMRVHSPDGSLRATLAFRAGGPVRILLAAVAGAGLCPALSTVDDLIAKRWPYNDPEVLAGMEKLVGSSSRLALVLGVFVVIPLAREAFFRGALFGQVLRSASATSTVVFTSILFALFSLDWRSMPAALVLGLALGWLRARTRSMVAPGVAHCMFWSVQAIPILRGVDPTADVTYPAKWIAGGVALSAVALGLTGVLRRAETSELR